MTGKKGRPVDGEIIDVEVEDTPRSRSRARTRDAAAKAQADRLVARARERAQSGTEAFVDAASAGLMAGALLAAQPLAEFLREVGDDIKAALEPEDG